MVTVRTARERSAGGTGTADRPDRSVRHRGQDPPHPLQSRANRVRPNTSLPPRKMTARRRPAALDAAREPARLPPQTRSTSTRAGLSAEPCASLASLRGPAATLRRRRTIRAHRRRRTTPRAEPQPPIRRATTMRCTARSNPAHRTFSAIPAYPDDPYAYQSGYEDEPEPQQAPQRPGHGCRGAGAGRGGNGGCLRLSHLCRFAPQRRAADHQGRQQPDQDHAGASRCGTGKTPDRMAPGDGGEKMVSREEDAGRRQRQVRRTARGVSAAEPERQSAAGRQRGSGCAAAGNTRQQRHDAEQRAAQDQDSFGQG